VTLASLITSRIRFRSRSAAGGVDEDRLPGRRDPQVRLAAFDVDDINLERLLGLRLSGEDDAEASDTQ
jgi:hypothetical protein